MKNRNLSEWLSVQLAKNPDRIVLIAILVFNIVFFLIAAEIISMLSLSGTEHMGFIAAAFCTVTMILDPGCISYKESKETRRKKTTGWMLSLKSMIRNTMISSEATALTIL